MALLSSEASSSSSRLPPLVGTMVSCGSSRDSARGGGVAPSTTRSRRRPRHRRREDGGDSEASASAGRPPPLTLPESSSSEPLDPYAVLEIRRDATPPEMRDAYRRLALRNHPNRNFAGGGGGSGGGGGGGGGGGEASRFDDGGERRRGERSPSAAAAAASSRRRAQEWKFAAIAACYETLSVESHRRRYDAIVAKKRKDEEEDIVFHTSGGGGGGQGRAGTRGPANSFNCMKLGTSERRRGSPSGGDHLVADGAASTSGSSSSGRGSAVRNLFDYCAPNVVVGLPSFEYDDDDNDDGTDAPPVPRQTLSHEDYNIHYTEAETDSLFGGPLALLYRARNHEPFTDPYLVFNIVFRSDVFGAPVVEQEEEEGEEEGEEEEEEAEGDGPVKRAMERLHRSKSVGGGCRRASALDSKREPRGRPSLSLGPFLSEGGVGGNNNARRRRRRNNHERNRSGYPADPATLSPATFRATKALLAGTSVAAAAGSPSSPSSGGITTAVVERDDGSIVVTKSRVVDGRRTVRTETTTVDPTSGAKRTVVTVTKEDLTSPADDRDRDEDDHDRRTAEERCREDCEEVSIFRCGGFAATDEADDGGGDDGKAEAGGGGSFACWGSTIPPAGSDLTAGTAPTTAVASTPDRGCGDSRGGRRASSAAAPSRTSPGPSTRKSFAASRIGDDDDVVGPAAASSLSFKRLFASCGQFVP